MIKSDLHVVRLSDVTLWDSNPHEGDIDLLVRGFIDFGFNGALKLWRDNVVMAGNSSTKALQVLKARGVKPPKHIAVDTDGEWLVPFIDISHLTRRKAEAFALADNRTSERSHNDEDRLAGLLQQIAIDEPDLMPAVGYSQDDLDHLLGLLGGVDENAIDDTNDSDESGDAGIDTIPAMFDVLVKCKSEAEQTTLLERLIAEGYTCKAQNIGGGL